MVLSDGSTDLRPHSRLLVIDDDVFILKLLKSILSKANYEITTCVSAEKAIELLDNTRFDCILTDAVMPQLDGFEFTKKVRNDPFLSDIPILMLTRRRE